MGKQRCTVRETPTFAWPKFPSKTQIRSMLSEGAEMLLTDSDLRACCDDTAELLLLEYGPDRFRALDKNFSEERVVYSELLCTL